MLEVPWIVPPEALAYVYVMVLFTPDPLILGKAISHARIIFFKWVDTTTQKLSPDFRVFHVAERSQCRLGDGKFG